MEAVAAGDEVAFEGFGFAAGVAEIDFWLRRANVLQTNGFRFVVELTACCAARRGEILQDLVLSVDGDGFSAGEIGEIDAMAGAIETQLDAFVNQAFAFETRAYAGLLHQVDGALLEDAGTNALLDVFLGAGFQDDGFDSLEMEKMREGESGGACSDDSDLRSHQ